MQRRHLANKMTMTTLSIPVLLLNRTKNKRSYLFKFLTPVMAIIKYFTVMAVIVVIY